MHRECYTNQKVTFDKRSHKRLTLHIPDAKTNCIPYPLVSTFMGKRFILQSRKSFTSLRFCTEIEPEKVCDKIRLARLSAGKLQKDMAEALGIDRITYLRYEMGQVAEHNMRLSILVGIAEFCGKPVDFCLNGYLKILLKGVGKCLKDYRHEHALTQKQLAAQLGVAQTTVRRWETEEARPSPVYIQRLFGI